MSCILKIHFAIFMTRSGKLSLRGRHPKGGKGERQREDQTREDRGTFSLCSRVHFDFPPFLRPATQAEVNYTPLVFYRSAAEFKGKCKTVKLFAKHMKVTLINRLWIEINYTLRCMFTETKSFTLNMPGDWQGKIPGNW